GGETPFTLDATEAVRTGANRLAVRVLNPTHEPIDGIVLNETPHRNKALPYGAGSAWDQGGIIDDVELLLAPEVRLTDLVARPDCATGRIGLEATVLNAREQPQPAALTFTVAPAASGHTLDVASVQGTLPPGESTLRASLSVGEPRVWDLNDPFLYRVTARVAADELSVRCGFREFRFEDGAFRLNGRRIYLRCSHTGNCCPVGLELPVDPDWLRRDLLNVKVMGFNAIRFIAGIPKRYQLDLCDEVGLMVYEENYAAWCLADSPKMPERFARSTREMILRDRNHPSVVIWGMLNETPDGPVFRQAAASLALVRSLDPTRMVLLNSGRWDSAGGGLGGLEVWRNADREDPCVTHNPTDAHRVGLGIDWAPGDLAFHPGRNGEYAVVRFTAPAAGEYAVQARFWSIAQRATTDVHVLAGGQALFDGRINVGEGGPECSFAGHVALKAGETLDFACGWGNGNYGADTTALAPVVTSAAGDRWDAAEQFAVQGNPNGVWSYGVLPPADAPDASAFQLFPSGEQLGSIGALSNPGSDEWENVLSDQHIYPRVPHTAEVIRQLRTASGGANPVFISEYGIGSAVDLVRVARHYERLGATHAEDAQYYRACLDRFMADWEAWGLANTFDSPEAYFAACLAKMADQRALGLNAIRANPNVVAHSLTGTVDQGMTGEGLFTTFRELKPGTTDAIFDGFYPLRWCLFAEPGSVYRGATVRLEAVLANEDALPAGKHPARVQLIDPGGRRLLDRRLTVDIPAGEGPFALPVFAEEVALDGPAGTYRFVAALEQGGAAAGREARVFVADPADMPPVTTEVALFGDDPGLAQWLAAHGIAARAFSPESGTAGVILASGAPPDEPAWTALTERLHGGAAVVFLQPQVLARADDPLGWLPLEPRGRLQHIGGWLYLADEWAKRHPIFEGLPAGGLMDYAYYRELIPNTVFTGQGAPAEAVAGSMKTSQDYTSGLLVGVWEAGRGRVVLNSLHVRENLGSHPAAERLLRNLLNYADDGG
ncbi:MAG: glycoside hydrolase family 2, partial [Armatimonadetes bacterium]|nr:glycoside hydrolase family 2 [Armatimonadota bacterium]